ncbi:Serine/threonine-protein phosphatase 2A 56 kDa regulatory subunit like [Verticillium longisporum]|nr:Serine/threonine-protein phosphatase 2A 56 kDa regulatory subunit like [Verticillium longisporum]
MNRFSQRVKAQLSRGKDPNKPKKSKDSKDGAASPSSVGSGRDANQSPVLTPSSSTSTLNDIRNKPLPSGTATDHGAPNQPSPLSNQQTAGQDRFGGTSQASNGNGTPSRLGALPPSVVISPSAPHVPPPGAAETMPHDLAPPKAGTKSLMFDRLHQTPKDVPEGMRTPKRQHSSRFDISADRELEKLPGFHEVPPNRRQDLFMQKIDQCNVIFDFNDASGDMKSKEIKRLALHELLDYASCLKTARDLEACTRQTMQDGEAFFHRQLEELRAAERRKKILATLWAYRRGAGAVGVAVLVGLAAFYLRRTTAGSGPLGVIGTFFTRWTNSTTWTYKF